MKKGDIRKRVFDVFFSAVFLIFTSPLLILIATLISLTSKGAPLYRSMRLGAHGKMISCLKFRTMVQDADKKLEEILLSDVEKHEEWKVYQKLKQDPRITWIGKFLRRTSLDEAPQFWNVLKGDLSIVGPRPLTLLSPGDPLEQVQSIYGGNTDLILSVKPGITGIWQVSGRSHISLQERQKMEANYVLKRTFWTDLIVIAKTIPAVIFSKGAF